MDKLQQPKTLRVFFLTEMWERYGFYVVQTLLAIYLAMHFQWPDKKVYSLIGSFTALTYLSPFVGGWLADRYLGQKRSVLLGALILLISYTVLSFSHQIPTLIASLASIAVGTGLLKPNIATLLGNQYHEESVIRENGFTIFYLGITTGIILGTTFPSVFKLYFGWQMAFLSAAFGMLLSLFSFIFGIRHFDIEDYPSERIEKPSNLLYSGVILFLLGCLNYQIMLHTQFANLAFPAIALIASLYMFYCMVIEEKSQAKKTLMILFLCAISVIFWSFYFQMFMSLTLFIIRVVESHWMSITFPPPYYVAVQSLGMIVIGFITTRSHIHHTSSIEVRTSQIINKFIMALGLILITYLWIAGLCRYSNATNKMSAWLILPGYLLISKAELLLSPVGTSAMTILACRKKVSTMMGIFFVSLGLGGYCSGKLAGLTAITEPHASLVSLKSQYAQGFSNLAMILFLGLILSLILKWASLYILKQRPK